MNYSKEERSEGTVDRSFVKCTLNGMDKVMVGKFFTSYVENENCILGYLVACLQPKPSFCAQSTVPSLNFSLNYLPYVVPVDAFAPCYSIGPVRNLGIR